MIRGDMRGRCRGTSVLSDQYDIGVMGVKRRAVAVVLTMGLIFLSPLLVHVPLGETVSYSAWTLAWWLVGTRVVTVCSRADRVSRVVLGGVAGIVVQLANWAAWVLLGMGRLSAIGLLIALAWVTWSLRRDHARPRSGTGNGPADEPAAVSASREGSVFACWAWLVSCLVTIWSFLGFAATQNRPPGTSTMFTDLYWHLGIVAELKRSVLPEVPQADVGRLNYHWLSDAYMAAGSLGSRASATDTALVLWCLPVVALTFGLCLVVGRRLSGSCLCGGVAAILLAAPAAISPLGWLAAGPSRVFLWLSPSQIFGLVFTLFMTYLLIPVLRGERLTIPTGVLLVVTAVLCAGSKSSILPVFLGGAVLTGVLFVRSRAARRGALVVMAACGLGLAVAMPLFAGGSAGSKIRLLSSFRRSAAYQRYTGVHPALDHGSFVMPYLATGEVMAIVVALLVLMGVQYGYAAVALNLGETWRRDPLPVFLIACFTASLAAHLLIDHTGMSQVYFPMGALPLLALLAGWGIEAAWVPTAQHRGRYALLAGGFTAGGLAVFLSRILSGSALPEQASIPSSMAWGCGGLVVALAVCLWLTRRVPAFGIGILMGAAVVNPLIGTLTTAGFLAGAPRPQTWTVTAPEGEAAQWLRDHSGQHDLVATNVHCRNVVTAMHCDARAYWVSALTERRVLIESWGYTDEAQTAAGKGGIAAVNQPYQDQPLYRINEEVFNRPSAAGVSALRENGVRYLFGDSRASVVSPDLPRYATLVHEQGSVRIYRIEP